MAGCVERIRDTDCMKVIDYTEPLSMVINSYAVFMGYLSMATKGIGFLILTWTTVVLLGGFVSMIDNRDFWCLTFITLVQTAGIFDVYLNEKLSYILYSAMGFFGTSCFAFMGDNLPDEFEDHPVKLAVLSWIACLFVFVQMLVLAILLCPLAAVYVFGVLISAGISLWRLVLVKHDYPGNSKETTNLKPALYTLYCLAILQGMLFLYRFAFSRVGKKIAKTISRLASVSDELKAILNYLHETKIGCDKNPSFARGRNFITHAIDLIISKSPDDCLSGVQLLYTSIHIWERRLQTEIGGKKFYDRQWRDVIRQHMLRKTLIASASTSHVLQKVLLQTLNPRGRYNREMRNQAAKIVVYLAIDIHLEKFPDEIQYISTLIGTFEEYRLVEPYNYDRIIHRYDQDWDLREKNFYRIVQDRRLPAQGPDEDKLRESYEKMVLRGLCILRKLATHENNCRIMSETQGLLPKIMAPLTSDIIHQFSGGAWSIMVVEGSLKVMRLLVDAPGDTGAKIRQEFLNNKEAVHTMERILSCDNCHVKLQKQAMGMLIQLYMETKSRSDFIKMLVDIFVASGSRDRSIRKLAGEALVKLCIQSESNAGIILHVDVDIVGSLTKILLDVKDKTCRIRAAEILEHMCNIHQTQDDRCLSKLKETMTTTMPKVVAEILGYELRKDETKATTEADQIEVVVKQDGPQEHAQDKTSPSSSSTHPEYKEDEEDVDVEEDEFQNDADEEFRAPLLSLCVMICDTFVDADQDLASRFGAINLPKKLQEMVEWNSDTMVRYLRLMKVTCKMVISMMKHGGSYFKQDLDSLMGALSNASTSMAHLDMSTVFASEDDGAQATKPVRSLSSLVLEAKESVGTRMATEAHESENIMEVEPSTSGPRQ